jgi:transcriptional regulator with XRE-family HTH domain
MDTREKKCRELLSRNIKRFRDRLGFSQMDLALELDISTTFLSDIELGKKWVSARTLTRIAGALKIEVFELFKAETPAEDNGMKPVVQYLDDVDDTIIKTLELSIRPTVENAVAKMRKFYKQQLEEKEEG